MKIAGGILRRIESCWGLMLVGILLFLCFGVTVSFAGKYYTVNIVTLSDGTTLEEHIINGPPVPPPGFEVERQAVSIPEPDVAAGKNILTVPAYNWVFGCSAVSAAMIAAYYDRVHWRNIYTGPTNGGFMPLDNSSWPTWSDGDSTYPSCPLVASKNGVDGRTTRGSIDDYWVRYKSDAPDPYIANGWTQHTWGTAIGDYMKTSQSAYGLVDGATAFWSYTSSTPRQCANLPANDGTLGMKQFYEARGYVVTECYNQPTDNRVAGGFSFAQFKGEIDAGRPVMLHLEGHTIVGVGYDDATGQVYIHDTWDYDTHTMTWGNSYAGMALVGVSVVRLQPIPPLPPLDADLIMTIVRPLLFSQTPTVDVTASDPKASEPGTDTGKFTFTRTGSTETPLTVKYRLAGTAKAGIDYVALSGTVRIPAGATSRAALVTPLDDTIVEPTETVRITLSDDAAYRIGSSKQAVVSIFDDEKPRITITATTPVASEPGIDKGKFLIRRTGSLAADLLVKHAVSGTATPGTDYKRLPGTLTMPAGISSKTIAVVPLDDRELEQDETVILTLTGTTVYTVGTPKTATVTIESDD